MLPLTMKLFQIDISLNIFYFQNCTLQHINNTITQRNRIGTKAYSLYSSSPEIDIGSERKESDQKGRDD